MSDDDTTRIITRRSVLENKEDVTTIKIGVNNPSDKDSETKLFRPKSSVGISGEYLSNKNSVSEFEIEPVVGWLVVVEGPGKGQSLKLGYGMNTIGRGADQRVSLDFGDEEISRQGHAMLTYDQKGRKFYIQHGGGTNLTYLGDSPVLQPHEITGREIIGLGNTKLCFISFCGPEFDW
jgi:hypothetical protein